MKIDRMIRDEEGFTAAGMAVALLVTLSLLFSATQVYRINTASAGVQDVADAAALAAEGQVAEFMVAVRVIDGAVLSLSLLGSASYGLGVVGLCVPPAAELGAQLISAGQKVLKARDRFAERAATSLNELQRALPFIAAASAASVAAANSTDRESGCFAVALLLPAQGKTIAVGSNAFEAEMEEAVGRGQDALADAAAGAEEAMRRANDAKRRAFLRDCGDNPGYCMYERAAHLASLGGADNPLFESPDTWSFPVARDRALAYYRTRLLTERPENDTPEAQARAALRKDFYAFAVAQLREADIREGPLSLEGSFPRFPRNLEQLRATSLYTNTHYPVEIEGEGGLPVMHAWEGCPGLGLTDRFDSVQVLEAGGFAQCEYCKFTPHSLGSVAAASTAIDNGFEYHYDAVARAAEEYQVALREAAPLAAEVKRNAQGLLDKVGKALRAAASMRIDAVPPGATGCIALVMAPGGARTPSSPFVAGDAGLGARAAISAATLVEDETEDASVIGNVLDGLNPPAASAMGAGRLVLRCWSAALKAYGAGQEALMAGVEAALGSLPLLGAAGLGPWAADALRTVLGTVGLEPASLQPLKPVLAQTAAVARADGGEYAVRFLALRDQALSSPATSPNPLGALADRIERDAYDRLSALEIEIAYIELPFGVGELPVTIALPPSVTAGAQGLVEQATAALRDIAGSLGWMDAWE